ncbi:MAG TPA: hypothetical protein VHP31_12290 [Caproicibacter sp.]|nr:hypothetical protein [Caproicibacter sp.]
MVRNELNLKYFTQLFVDKVAEVPEIGTNGALLSNPDTTAHFPACVIQPPISKPSKSAIDGAAYDLSITVEVWAGSLYTALGIFDEIIVKLRDYNLMLTTNTPQQYDAITKKWRYGGYFEVRWNAIDNSFEKNH